MPDIVVVCESCQTKNRVNADKLFNAICSSCKNPIINQSGQRKSHRTSATQPTTKSPPISSRKVGLKVFLIWAIIQLVVLGDIPFHLINRFWVWIFSAIWAFIMLIVAVARTADSCPKCHANDGKTIVKSEQIGLQQIAKKEKRQVKHYKTLEFLPTGHSEYYVDVPYQRSTTKTSYSCKYCGHTWSNTSTTDIKLT